MDIDGIRLKRPLGIVFEEVEAGQSKGLRVASLVPGGNADFDGRVFEGDKLIAVSAVTFTKGETLAGQKVYNNWERIMVTVASESFDFTMKAIESNSSRHGYTDVILRVRRTDDSVFRVPPSRRTERT